MTQNKLSLRDRLLFERVKAKLHLEKRNVFTRKYWIERLVFVEHLLEMEEKKLKEKNKE